MCKTSESNTHTPVITHGNTGYWLRSLYVRPLIVLSVIMYSKFVISLFLHRSEGRRREGGEKGRERGRGRGRERERRERGRG